MNVVKGGLGGSKSAGNRSMLTNFCSNLGLISSSKIASEVNKSAGSNVRNPCDEGNTTSETACTSGNIMGPPSAPSYKKRNTSASTSLDKTCNQSSDLCSATQPIPNRYLDLSQPKDMWTPKYRQPSSGQFTASSSRGHVSGGHTRTTPGSSTSNTTMPESCIVLALSGGRGAARGEVGIAAIDLRRPSLTLCQLSDSHSYIHTLTALHFFNPVEIIVSNTFCDNVPTELYRVVKRNLPNVTVTPIQRRHFSQTQGLHYIKNLCAPEYASVQLQLMHKFFALIAAAAVVKYVEYIQCIVFQPHSLKIEYHCSQDSTWIDVETAIRLELVESLSSCKERGVSLLSILNQTSTAGGVRALRVTILQPPSNLNKIKDRADAVQELLDNSDGLLPGLQNVMKQLYDVDKILWLCMDSPSPHSGSKAGEAQLNHTIQLKNTMDLVPALITALELAKGKWFSNVKKDLENPKFVEISERIKRVIHDGVHVMQGRAAQQQRCFAVKPEINGLLDVARRSYSELVSDIQERVEELASTYSLPLKLCNNATRGFHIGLPVGPKNKRTFNDADLPPVFIQVQNHGVNVSMTTEEVVLLDQQAKEALSEIQTMSNIVIFGLLTELRPYMSVLYKLCEHVAELDVILSLAQVSSGGYYVRPVFGEYLELKDSIHPLLDNVLPVPTVPNDVFASPEYNFHIITGPNMGGKTIYIKQIALLQIMAQIGCYVPATSATFRICDRIFTRIGFNDSIECNASTYILEMKEVQHILQTITPSSLVIIDELCRGTSSEEGTSMSWAVCERLLNTSAFTFFTTHLLYLTRLQDVYYNVVNLHLTAEEVVNPSNNQIRKLVYKHKVMPGVTTLERYGLTLASHTNLPDTVLALAHRLAEVIAAQKKPIPPSERKCTDEVVLYKLGADLLQEMRKPDSTDDRVQNIIEEFKQNHPDISQKFLNKNAECDAAESVNIMAESNHCTSTIRKLSQEDPMLPIEALSAIKSQYHNNNFNSSKDLSILSQIKDAQIIVKVTRNNSVTNASTPKTIETVQVTPAKRTSNNDDRQVVISESDDTSILNNTVYSNINITDECVDNRFQNPNERSILSNSFKLRQSVDSITNQPSTSKRSAGNYFMPPFKRPLNQLFHSDYNLSESLDSDDESTSSNNSTNYFKNGNNINSFVANSHANGSQSRDNNVKSSVNEGNAMKSRTRFIQQKQNGNVDENQLDTNLMTKLVDIFGCEQRIMTSHMPKLDNPSNAEDLEKILRDDEEPHCDSSDDDDTDSDDVD